MKKTNGFTLMELIVSVSVLAVILVAGTMILFRNLNTGGLSDAEASVKLGANQLFDTIERNIKFSDVESVGGGLRTDCVSAGASGFPGASLTVRDQMGAITTYSESINSRVASNSMEISSDNMLIKTGTLLFTWYCHPGIGDNIKISFSATDKSSNALVAPILSNSVYEKTINLPNSGL